MGQGLSERINGRSSKSNHVAIIVSAFVPHHVLQNLRKSRTKRIPIVRHNNRLFSQDLRCILAALCSHYDDSPTIPNLRDGPINIWDSLRTFIWNVGANLTSH